jgi:NAD(P)-dependent dehydrogenase (short-subunit alcohol dehydrogenase family)
MNNQFDLTGKRILITGASSGIGRACAICVAQLGASVVLTGRRESALNDTRVKMIDADRHSVIAGDIGEPSFVQTLLDRVAKIDGLVHAAGICPAIPIGVVDSTYIVESMRVNYFAFMELMRLCSRRKYVNGGFSAVAISSVSSEVGWSGGSLYSGSKGALSAAVRALALELAPKGMRVNAVCPSNIRTPMFDSLAGDMNDEAGLVALKAKQPLGLGSPEQVAWPVCFLLSDAASFITGVNLPVDGGYLAQ